MVVIHYCELCHLRAPAEAIAAALTKELGLQTELREGFWGTFKVVYDGHEVFNRWKHRGLIGRLGFGSTPRPAEIVTRVRDFIAARNSGTAAPGTRSVDSSSRERGSPGWASQE